MILIKISALLVSTDYRGDRLFPLNNTTDWTSRSACYW